MPRPFFVPLLVGSLVIAAAIDAPPVSSQSAPDRALEEYVPGPGEEWERRRAAQVGMDATRLAEAVRFALERETDAPRDLEMNHALGFAREPFGEAVGSFKERGDPTGIVVRGGYIVAEWGDPHRVDMTFSVTKSFITATVGLAYDRGLIRDLEDPVAFYVGPVTVVQDPRLRRSGADLLGEARPLEPFDSEHALGIAWDHLLRQTSDWRGTLWGKPDWADRPTDDLRAERVRERHAPGSTWEYNDVRVNLLALAATSVWRRPLPEVLREYLMDPIGASPTWRWHGYENSWIVLDGRMVQAVSGGGHWGGGMWISARDQARFGLLTLREGRWGDRQVLSGEFLRQATTPTAARPSYGHMNFFLNTGREFLPSAPESAFLHLGAGTNMVYVDPENDLVVVARWIERDALDGLVERVLRAIREGDAPVAHRLRARCAAESWHRECARADHGATRGSPMRGRNMPQLPRIRLFEDSAGATHATIDAEVDEAGALVVSGLDVGVTTEEIDEGEFGLRVPEAERVLLLLLKEQFGGRATVLDDLEAWLSDNGISYEIGA